MNPTQPLSPEKRESLRKEIEAAINRHSAEAGSNTPDFILAEYLTNCLVTFDKATTAREAWYGNPGPELPMSPPEEEPEEELHNRRGAPPFHCTKCKGTIEAELAFRQAGSNRIVHFNPATHSYCGPMTRNPA